MQFFLSSDHINTTISHGCWQRIWRKSLVAITQECYELRWTSPDGNIPKNSSCLAIYHPSQKTIQIRWIRHVGPCWRSKNELISNVLLWTPSHRWLRVGWPARTYLQQLCTDTGCRLEDQPRAMGNRDEWRERVSEISASSTAWRWWGWLYI